MPSVSRNPMPFNPADWVFVGRTANGGRILTRRQPGLSSHSSPTGAVSNTHPQPGPTTAASAVAPGPALNAGGPLLSAGPSTMATQHPSGTANVAAPGSAPPCLTSYSSGDRGRICHPRRQGLGRPLSSQDVGGVVEGGNGSRASPYRIRSRSPTARVRARSASPLRPSSLAPVNVNAGERRPGEPEGLDDDERALWRALWDAGYGREEATPD